MQIYILSKLCCWKWLMNSLLIIQMYQINDLSVLLLFTQVVPVKLGVAQKATGAWAWHLGILEAFEEGEHLAF